MAIFKCKMCGGALEVAEDITVATCEYCGTKQTLPRLDDDRKANMYNRANHFRRNNEFDKAMSLYEAILNENNTDAEAYWSLVLCRYGIEYVEDPATQKRIPTVNRTQYTSIFDNEDYKSALRYADGLQKSVYEAEAHAINEIQKGILEISQKEEPFDVFICYKETDADGKRTPDSVLATELYHELCKEGFKVFFSRITLEDKLGTAYEPYIFAALNSAKVMVALGTKQEHFNAVWVRNEWSRYLALIKNGAEKVLIPAYRDMDPYDLPDEFSHLQAQDMSKLGFMQDLVRGIRKIISANTEKPVIHETIINNDSSGNITALLKRGFMALEDGEWAKADTFFEQCLNHNAELAEAYLGKLMAEQKAKTQNDLADCALPFDKSNNYQKAVRFGDAVLVSELQGYIKHINERNEHNRIDSIYNHALSVMSKATTEEKFIQASEKFKSISGYKDADKLAEDCLAKAEEKRIEAERNRLEDIYNQALSAMSSERFNLAADKFKSIRGYKDSDKLAEDCLAKAEEKRIEAKRNREIAKKKVKKIIPITVAAVAVLIGIVLLVVNVIIPASKYNSALKLVEEGNYDRAIAIFTELGDYKDAKEKSFELWDKVAARETIAADNDHTVGLKSDGTVVAIGYNEYGQCDVGGWKDIVAVAAGGLHTVGLKNDGTVVAVGSNYYGQCDVGGWKDIVAVAAGDDHTVGLKSDGTVVAIGYKYGECDVGGWTDIVAVSAGGYHTVGLKSDGTVVAVGDNYKGQCDVGGWTDIVAVAAGDDHTVGLKSDGTVVAVGDNANGQCDVRSWKDIVAVAADDDHTVGLKSDGTVVAVGDNDYGQCKVGDWTDIVAVAAGERHTVGLKSDGTVVATKYIDDPYNQYDDYDGQCDVGGWKDIKQPNK